MQSGVRAFVHGVASLCLGSPPLGGLSISLEDVGIFKVVRFDDNLWASSLGAIYHIGFWMMLTDTKEDAAALALSDVAASLLPRVVFVGYCFPGHWFKQAPSGGERNWSKKVGVKIVYLPAGTAEYGSLGRIPR